MSVDLKVVELRPGIPSLIDLPGRLRKLADEIGRGEIDSLQTLMVVGIPENDFKPIFWCFGDNPDRHKTAGVMLHCAQLALTDKNDE